MAAVSTFFTRIRNWFQPKYQWTMRQANHRPIISFVVLLVILLALIAAGNFARKPKPEPQTQPAVKSVRVYRIGTAPKISVSAKVEKSDVIKITALTGGIVNKLNVEEGTTIRKGQTILSLSSNYNGASAPALQRQLAAAQYQNVLANYDGQKEIIAKQKELAERGGTVTEQIRKINETSLGDTRNLLTLQEDILSRINNNVTNIANNNPNGVNDQLLLSAKQLQAQYQAAVNQLRTGLKIQETQYTSSNDTRVINELTPRVAVHQLEVQERALDVAKESSRIQLQLAQVQESLLYPSSPVTGKVERIYVNQGQSVAPGTPIAQVSGTFDDVVIRALVPASTAQNVSQLEDSIIHVNGRTISVRPDYVSQEATDGQLYSIRYSIPDEYKAELTDKGFVTVDIPVGYANTGSAIPFIPLDAVYQTQDKAYIYVITNGKAESREVHLGVVNGSYVEVTSGLRETDQVILDRTVVAGDPVQSS